MGKKEYLFSIIVAIYNTEKYLNECITSVLNQDIGFEDNIELILVNDGSTDNSENICKKFLKMYPNNIKYIYQKNSGVSSARNRGLDVCAGKYINFLDSDDKFSENTCSVIESAIKSNKKVNIFSIRPEFFDRVLENTSVEHCYTESKVINIIKDKNYTQQAVNNVFIKSELLDKHRFNQNLSIGEDAMFMNTLFLDNPIYYVTNKATYFQRRREENDSLSEGAFKKKTFYIDTVKYYFKDIIQLSIKKYETVPIFLQNDIATYIAWMLQSNIVEKVLKEKEIEELINNLKSIVKYIDFEVINTNKDIEPEYKYMLLLLKKDDFGMNFSPKNIEFLNNSKNFNIEYIYANHSLNKYILDDDLKKLIIYSIEMNKFYVKHINEIDKLHRDIETTQNELSKISFEYNKLLSSKSWKITKPLRYFNSIIKKVVRRGD